MTLASVPALLEALRQGKPIVLLDDEDRENEGDLVLAADFVTPESIAFMACHGRGLICLALTNDATQRLGLQPMVPANRSRLHTNFTVSIEAREGITTGISAHDRAHTIQVAASPNAQAQHIVSPGHIFPLTARDGGVLVRTGHTEAAVDLARLAGLTPAGVICEIMKDDGTMARFDDLRLFCQQHNLLMGTIADLVAYRRRHDHLTICTAKTNVQLFGAQFVLHIYRNTLDGSEHAALTIGDIAAPDPVLVRMHTVHLFDDILGLRPGRCDYVPRVLQMLAKAGRGVCVLLRDTARAGALTTAVDEMAAPSATSHAPRMLRDYGIGAQILLDLGVRDAVLVSESPPFEPVALEGYGLRIVGHQSVAG